MADAPAQKPWTPSSPPVDAESFADVIEGPPTIIHFWAPWNPYDKPLDANIQQLKKKWGSKFRFFSVNVDETVYSKIVETYFVAALPTLLCFSNGKLRGRYHGVETLETLDQFFTDVSQARDSR